MSYRTGPIVRPACGLGWTLLRWPLTRQCDKRESAKWTSASGGVSRIELAGQWILSARRGEGAS
jgi:hypothetical protein